MESRKIGIFSKEEQVRDYLTDLYNRINEVSLQYAGLVSIVSRLEARIEDLEEDLRKE